MVETLITHVEGYFGHSYLGNCHEPLLKVIKTHHNVGGLPDRMKMEVIEPSDRQLELLRGSRRRTSSVSEGKDLYCSVPEDMIKHDILL